MSKLVLHIGTHKTATTTVQDTFWANAELLEAHGLIYPKLGRVTGHHGLVMAWGNQLPEIYHLPRGVRGTFEDLSTNWADQDKTVFLSSEEFSRGEAVSAVNFSQLREMASAFDEVKVLCVLRAQWQFLQSIYLERSKTYNPPRPPYIIEQAIDSGMCEGLWIDYNLLLDQLQAAFAPSEITFLDFHSVRAEPGGIIGAVLRHLDVPLESSELEEVNDGVSNVSPMSLASWAANILSEPLMAPAWLVEMNTEILKTQFGADARPCLFTREEFTRLQTHFEALNEIFCARREKVQPGFHICGMDSEELNLFRQRIDGDFWLRCSRRVTQRILTSGH